MNCHNVCFFKKVNGIISFFVSLLFYDLSNNDILFMLREQKAKFTR